MRFFPVFLLCGLLAALPVSAASPKRAAPAPKAEPTQQLEVTADESLEWYQNQHLYVARGNAKAVRGEVVFEADILSAHAREEEKAQADAAKADGAQADKKNPEKKNKDKSLAQADQGGMGSIDRLMAEGNVRITDPKQKVFGDKAVYDLDRRVATVTGEHLKYETASAVVTARDSLDYYEAQDIAVARGNAKAVRTDGSRIDGDVLTAHFVTNEAGQKDMTTMTAEGHVTVYTDGDVARGERATYDVKKNTATLIGNVRITRESTQLAGDRAEVDFASGQSKLLNDGHGRVRALLPSRATQPKDKAAQSKTEDAPVIDPSVPAVSVPVSEGAAP